ncbi:unnamed protein product [Symbiodinium sp. CCMP2592]|nr:unnamed protein product [Symbiodinium sp. CCMP2592]
MARRPARPFGAFSSSYRSGCAGLRGSRARSDCQSDSACRLHGVASEGVRCNMLQLPSTQALYCAQRDAHCALSCYSCRRTSAELESPFMQLAERA